MTSLEKNHVCRAFNAASKTYDTAADWQKSIGDILIKHINNLNPEGKTILDLGSGAGYMLNLVKQHHPNNSFFAVDIAENMLRFCQQNNHGNLICSDAENLALHSESVDIVISNIVLHWCDSLLATFKEQYRILKPGGYCIFSIPGPNSLLSLENAWKHVDQHSHINVFPSQHIIKQSYNEAGFSSNLFERHEIQKNYDNIYELMRHLKETGATNISTDKPKGLMGKNKLKQLSAQYQNPVNYEIFIGVLSK